MKSQIGDVLKQWGK